MRDYLGAMIKDELPWDIEEVREIRALLLAFFDTFRRPLPWRETSDPYRILVSEVMSQQTRLDTVVPYYRKWMERFPDLETLSQGSSEEVLALWQGLGYYSRARNLLKTAREVVARYGGELPREADELQRLPGIGPYTAGAVASIAFEAAVPAVDGNVRRVLSRLAGRDDVGAATLRAWARELVDPHRPGDFNQALMELGAQRCTPRSPDCQHCPLTPFCAGHASGAPESFPRTRATSPVPHRHEAVPMLLGTGESGGRAFLLRRRPDEGLLAGMWEFPSIQVGPGDDVEAAAHQAAHRFLEDGAALKPEGGLALAPLSHTFSHLKVTYHPVLFRVEGVEALGGECSPEVGPGPVWVFLDQVDDRPLPVAQQKLMAQALEEEGRRGQVRSG